MMFLDEGSMRMSYLQVTSFRVFVALFLVFAVIRSLGLLALLLSVAFVGLHWWAQRMGQRRGLQRHEYQYSSLLSSFVVLIVFVVLLTQAIIPVVLAAVFIAIFIIKMIFSLQDEPMRSTHDRKKPVKTNWSLAASFMFLACYYFGENHNLALVSSLFLSYLLFSIGIYSKKITELQARNRQQPLVGRR